MAGIQETKEVLVAVNEVGVLAVTVLKDGVQLKDDFETVYAKLVTDEGFKAKVLAAYTDIGKVPAEMSDLDFVETFDLVRTQISFVPRYVAALKGA